MQISKRKARNPWIVAPATMKVKITPAVYFDNIIKINGEFNALLLRLNCNKQLAEINREESVLFVSKSLNAKCAP